MSRARGVADHRKPTQSISSKATLISFAEPPDGSKTTRRMLRASPIDRAALGPEFLGPKAGLFASRFIDIVEAQ